MNVSDSENQLRKRVLYVITLSDWGGAQKYVFDLAVAARAQGHAVKVVVGGTDELYKQLVAASIDTVSLSSMRRGISLFAEFNSLSRLVRIMREFHPDIVHANSSKAGVLAPLASRLAGRRKNIFTSHGWAFNETHSLLKQVLYRLFHYVGLLFSDQIICVSEAIRRDVMHWPFIRRKLQVIHLGVEVADLLSVEEARDELLRNNPRQGLWIGAVGRLDPVKQHDVLIHAFNAVHQAFPDVSLLIVGEGKERASLEGLIKKYSLQESVFLCGHRENAQRYMRAFDIFAFPSFSESFGFVAAEAGLASLPVVASGVGGIPEIITDGENGILIPRENPEALAAALSKLIQDPELRQRYGTALHEKVLRDFTKPKMIEKTFALY